MERQRFRLTLLGLIALLLCAARPAGPPVALGGQTGPAQALLTIDDLGELSVGWEVLVDDCGVGACRRGPLRCQFDISNLCIVHSSAGSGVSTCPRRQDLPEHEPVASAQTIFRQPALGIVLVHVVAVFTPDEAAREIACTRSLLEVPGGSVSSPDGTVRFTPLLVEALGEESVAVRVAVERRRETDVIGPCDIVAGRRGGTVVTLELCWRDADPREADSALMEQLARRAAERLKLPLSKAP